MATFAEIQDAVKTIINRDITEVTGNVATWVKRAQEAVLDLGVDWWFLRSDHTFTTVDGTASYDLQTTYQQTRGVYILLANNYTPLQPGRLADLRLKYGDGTVEGQPLEYAIDIASGIPGKIYLFPEPDDAYSILHDCRLTLAALTTDSSTNFLTNSYPALLEAEAAVRGFRVLREWELANQWGKVAKEEFAGLWAAHYNYTLSQERRLVPRKGADLSATLSNVVPRWLKNVGG